MLEATTGAPFKLLPIRQTRQKGISLNPLLGPAIYSKLLTTLTGIEFSPEEVRKTGDRISNIQQEIGRG